MSLIQETANTVAGAFGRNSPLVRVFQPLYETYLRWVGRRDGIPWVLNGVTYRIDPAYRARLGHDYDPELAAFLKREIRPGSLCFNVGANIGVYVLQLAHWSGPGGKVVAFEPNPVARAVLSRHIDCNGLVSRVRVVPAAVSDTPGEATLFAVEADGMSRLGAPNPSLKGRALEEVPVSVTTLDQFCEAEGLVPDWITIDIEGFEIAALRGARNLIARAGAGLRIVVEMHPNVWSTANTTRSDAERLLDELGLRARPLSGQTDPLGDYGHILIERR